jgi:hypothetical protein
MPYHLRKSPKKNLYWVVNAESGRKYSKLPIPKERAEAQRRAIYASENGYILNKSRKSKSKSKTKYRPTPRYLKRYTEFSMSNDSSA